MWDYNAAEPFDFVSAIEEEAAEVPDPPEDAIVIRTLVDQMRFDTESFTVRAGETVKIWFENGEVHSVTSPAREAGEGRVTRIVLIGKDLEAESLTASLRGTLASAA